jgi:hypothetical protein
MINENRPHLIHLHGSTKPTLQTFIDNNVQLGEIVVYHGKDEQALYVLTNDLFNYTNNDENGEVN